MDEKNNAKIADAYTRRTASVVDGANKVEEVEDDGKGRNYWVVAGLSSFFVFVVLGGLYIYFFLMPISDAEFQEKVQQGGEIWGSQGTAEAILYFQSLVGKADTPRQEGQAKLNLGVALLGDDRERGVSLLKEVSVNNTYHPFTRAKAVNYVLNEYTATKDVEFAQEHIFTGPTWNGFLSGGNLSKAVIEGFEFSTLLAPTPEASMRLAAEYAFQLDDLPVEQERNKLASEILEHIEKGDEVIASLQDSGSIRYGNTDPEEIAAAYNRKGLALDVLYFQGYIDNSAMVEDAFRDALDTIIAHGGTGTELYIRYLFADFLLRLDAEGRREAIEKILVSMDKLHTEHNAAEFFKRRLADRSLDQQKKDTDVARSDNIARLASISPEFWEALLRIGVPEKKLIP